jgi:hypothetical protein
VDHVERLDGEVDRPVARDVELRRGELLARRVVVEEGPRELLADDPHVERVGLGLLDVGQRDVRVGAEPDEEDRRDRGPDDLQPRVAVDRRTVLELLARLHSIAPDAVQDDHHHEHEDRYGEDHQDVPDRVDGLRLGRGLRREPVDREA